MPQNPVNRPGTEVAYEFCVGLWFTAGAVNAGGSQAGTQDGVLTRPILNFFANPSIHPLAKKFYVSWARFARLAVMRPTTSTIQATSRNAGRFAKAPAASPRS